MPATENLLAFSLSTGQYCMAPRKPSDNGRRGVTRPEASLSTGRPSLLTDARVFAASLGLCQSRTGRGSSLRHEYGVGPAGGRASPGIRSCPTIPWRRYRPHASTARLCSRRHQRLHSYSRCCLHTWRSDRPWKALGQPLPDDSCRSLRLPSADSL